MQIQTTRRPHHPIHRAAQVRTKRIGAPIASVAVLLSLTMIGSNRGPRRANAEEPTVLTGPVAHEAYAALLAARSRAQKAEAIERALQHWAPVRCDDGQRTCELMALSGGWHDIAYSKQTCPQGDGQAKGGYDTISFAAVAKNIMTVGAVHGPVSEGIRDLSYAAMTDFSRWGPTDDGRIKPDIVAAGVGTTLSDDPTSRLIHDLDLRVIGPDESTAYYPYILNPVEPTAPATTGDNARDNVEQVCLPTPSERGLYEVRVSCRSDLRAERGGMKDRRFYPSRTCDAARAACRSGKKVNMRSRLVIRNTRCNWESRVQTATWPPCGLT